MSHLNDVRNETWEYEKRKYPIIINTVPDFTAQYGHKSIVVELKGQANPISQRIMLATNALFHSRLCRVFLSSTLPEDVLDKFQKAIEYAYERGINVDTNIIPDTRYIVAPFSEGNSGSSSHNKSGSGLVAWCRSQNIVCAPISYTNFRELDELLDCHRVGLTK